MTQISEQDWNKICLIFKQQLPNKKDTVMNKNLVITNITLISDAAEYFDRKVGSAWKIRAAMTNMLVWAANRLVAIKHTDNMEQLQQAQVTLATLRVWAQDMNTSSLTLDLLHGSVRRTLGLEREINPHDEACRVARNKCQQARSALRFQEFYNAAYSAVEEQQRRREEAVEEIVNLLSSNSFGGIPDVDLYDETSVDYQFDQLSERLANVLESMYVQCDQELTAAIVSNKIMRLEGYMKSIEHMMQIVGVDQSKLARRQVTLEQAMKDAEAKILTTRESVNADIEGEISKLMAQQAIDDSVKKPTRRMVKAAQA